MRLLRTLTAIVLIAGVVYIASCTVIDGCFVRGFKKDSAYLNGVFEPLDTSWITRGTLWSHAKMSRVRVKQRINITNRFTLTSLLSLRKNRIWRDQRVTLRRWSENDADFQVLWENKSMQTQSRTFSVHCTHRAQFCEVQIGCRAFPRVGDVFPLSKYLHSQFVEDLTRKPITCLIIAGLVGIFLHLRFSEIHFTNVSISYTRVVEHGEVWRIFTASVSHCDLWHILFNVSTAYSIGSLEAELGPAIFVQYIVVLMAGSMVLMMAIVHVCLTRCKSDFSALRDQMALGYSAVLFGLITVACATSTQYCLLPGMCFATYELPTPWHPFKFNLAPFVLMGITQCVVRQSSLLGHLSGLLVGFVAPWLPLTPPSVVYACGLWYVYLSKQRPRQTERTRAAAWVVCSAIGCVGFLMAFAFLNVTEVLSVGLGLTLWVKCTRWIPESTEVSVHRLASVSQMPMLRRGAALGLAVEFYWLLLLSTATFALRHVINDPDGQSVLSLGLSISSSILLSTSMCMVSCLSRLCFFWGRCRLLSSAVTVPAQCCQCVREWGTNEEEAALMPPHHLSMQPRVVQLIEHANANSLQADNERYEAVGLESCDVSIPQATSTDMDLVRAKRLEFLNKTQRR